VLVSNKESQKGASQNGKVVTCMFNTMNTGIKGVLLVIGAYIVTLVATIIIIAVFIWWLSIAEVLGVSNYADQPWLHSRLYLNTRIKRRVPCAIHLSSIFSLHASQSQSPVR
jgi:hypothetical protein